MNKESDSLFDVDQAERLLKNFQQIIEQLPNPDGLIELPIQPLNLAFAQRVIDEFAQLNFPPERKKTFLEILERGHLENVSSKTLAFFLDSTEEHGLRDLCLQVMMDLAKKPFNHCITTKFIKQEITCWNEDKTQSGRIDLVIETDQHIIVIENKLYHHANSNPFDLYQSFFDKEYEGLDRTYILIGLNKPTRDLGEFRFVSHFDFVKEVKNRLGHHLMKADQHYVTHLIDYLDTIDKINPNTETGKMEQAIVDFYRSNREILEKIEDNRKFVHDYYKQQLFATISLIDLDSIFSKSEYHEYVAGLSNIGGLIHSDELISKNTNLKIQFSLDKSTAGAGLYIRSWLTSFKRDKQETLKMLNTLDINSKDSELTEGWFQLLDLNENISAEEFANQATPFIKKILDHHNQISSELQQDQATTEVAVSKVNHIGDV